MVDVAIVGGGIAGMATAARLQARGLSTIVLESHGQPGGCAGFFRRKRFSFDVGATTLVDFEPGGVGGEFLEWIGMGPIDGERLPGYVAWLPDRTVTLHRDPQRWAAERLRAFGSTASHRDFLAAPRSARRRLLAGQPRWRQAADSHACRSSGGSANDRAPESAPGSLHQLDAGRCTPHARS